MTWTRRHMLQLGGAAIAATALPSLAEFGDCGRRESSNRNA